MSSTTCATDTAAPPLHSLDTVDSTSLELRRRLERTPDLPDGYALLAREQTAGHGRLDRVWHSRAGENMLCSFWLRLDMPPRDVMGFSLAPSLAVLDVLNSYAVPAGCKWPNDIRVDGRKLCGILTEAIVGPQERLAGVIVGIGLNILSAPPGDPPPITLNRWASPSPWELAGLLQQSLLHYALRWRQGDKAAILQEWTARCDHLNLPVRVTVDGQKVTGIARGLGQWGQLLLELDGCVREIWSDDVESTLSA